MKHRQFTVWVKTYTLQLGSRCMVVNAVHSEVGSAAVCAQVIDAMQTQ